MDAGILVALRDYLNERTMPGRAYQLGPGIAWSVALPKQNAAEDLKATLQNPQVRTLIGLITPAGSRLLETSRGHYGYDQPRGGALREAEVYLTVFARSMKAYAFDGELLEIEDLLQELLGDFSAKDHPGVQGMSLGSQSLMSLPPDFSVLEFDAAVRYLTTSKSERAARLRQITLGGSVLDFIVDLQEPPEEDGA